MAWRDVPTWAQTLVVVGSGLGVGALAAFVVDGVRRRAQLPLRGYRQELPSLPDLLDYESDAPDEPEPPDIEYDEHDAPCVQPPHPWTVPVAVGFEGAPEEGCTPPAGLVPQRRTEVAFTQGAERPRWPVDTEENRKIRVSYVDVRGKWHGRWGREFGASRTSSDGGKRVHVGVDLFGDPGDVVLAMEDGEILGGLPFYKGTGALYQLTDSGHIINYGELEHRSWKDYDVTGAIGGGQRVRAGDPIGRIGLSDDGSHMLHMETYRLDVAMSTIRRGEMRWLKGQPPPEGILDPTEYLLRAHRIKHESLVQKA